MYDVIIIGLGPAAVSAGIYTIRRELKTLIIGKEPGGQVMWASEIENYPGFNSIKSFDLIRKMQEHLDYFKAEIKNDEVTEIRKNDDWSFTVFTNKDSFRTKTVIVAIGLSPRRLAILGEEKFVGRGVTYCATCDGPFYKGKDVAVVGGGNAALDAAEYLSKIANQVYLVHRRDEFRGFESMVGNVKCCANIELVLSSEIKEISGQDKVEKIKAANVKSGEEREIKVDGVFVEIGRIANTDLVSGLVDRNEKNQIIVDEKCQTNQPGIFAAGDVTNGKFKQIIIAAGQGAVAALSAYQYIQKLGGKSVVTILDRGKKKE
jgi:alkyl hydroperoxide reductase subunit F